MILQYINTALKLSLHGCAVGVYSISVMKVLDFADVKMGYGFRSKIQNSPNGNVPVIQPKDISDDGLLRAKDVYRVEDPPIKPGHILTVGDVLLATRGRFTSTVYSGQFEESTIASGSLLVLTIKKEVMPEYLALHFNSDRGNHLFHRITGQTTIPYLNRSNLEQMDIPVPPLETQQKLIALKRAKVRYGVLTRRKQEVLNKILNHQLSTIG